MTLYHELSYFTLSLIHNTLFIYPLLNIPKDILEKELILDAWISLSRK